MSYPVQYSCEFHPYELDRCDTVAFSTNRDGDKFFTVRMEYQRVFEEEMLSVTRKVTICRHSMIRKLTEVFDLDFNMNERSGNLVEFYLLNDNFGVLLTYDPDSRCLAQIMVQLMSWSQWYGKSGILTSRLRGVAVTVCERRKTINNMDHTIAVAQGLLQHGQILVSGYKAQGLLRQDRAFVEAHLIAANPLHVDKYPDVDLSENLKKLANMAESSKVPDVPEELKIYPYLSFIDKNAIYMHLVVFKNEMPVVNTKKLAVLKHDGKQYAIPSIVDLDDSAIEYPMYLYAERVLCNISAGKSQFLCVLMPDYEELSRWSWKLYNLCFYVEMRLLYYALRFCMLIAPLDGGFVAGCFLDLMQFTFGSGLMPRFTHPRQFYIYALNTKSGKFKKLTVDAERTVGSYRTVMDTTANGKILLGELPCIHRQKTDNQDQMIRMTSLYDPSFVPTLQDIANRKAVKELGPKAIDPEFRRSLGVSRNWL